MRGATSPSQRCRRGANRLVPLALAALLLASPRSLPAQEAGGWLGKRVLLQFNSVLRVGDTVVDDQKREARGRGGPRETRRIYRVDQVNGPWLWLQAEGEVGAGWILAAEVIPYDGAIDYFTNQIRANPANGSAYTSRGHLWHDKKEYDLALADYNEAIRLDPGSEVAWCNRGIAWHDKSEYDKAIADYAEAIRLDVKYASAYANRGIAWHDKSEYDKAIADYAEAIRLDPKDSWAYFGRAVLAMTTRRDGAVAGMRTVVELERGKGQLATYAVILGHLAARIAGDAGVAAEFLGPWARDLDTTAWPYPAVRFLRGDLDEGPFLALAVDTDMKTEARCFLGLRRGLEGRREEALTHYRWVKEHGTRSFVEYQIAVAELARLEAAAGRGGPGPAVKPAGPKPATPEAGVAKLLGTILYVPTPQMEARFGADPQPIADYVNALKARANAVLAEAEPTTARGLLVAVGIKAGRRSKVWCQPVEGSMPAALVRTLERELGEVEAVALKAGPAGFGLQFGLNGKTPAEFPKFPGRWDDAAGAGRSKALIPPDDLFKILWPD